MLEHVFFHLNLILTVEPISAISSRRYPSCRLVDDFDFFRHSSITNIRCRRPFSNRVLIAFVKPPPPLGVDVMVRCAAPSNLRP